MCLSIICKCPSLQSLSPCLYQMAVMNNSVDDCYGKLVIRGHQLPLELFWKIFPNIA